MLCHNTSQIVCLGNGTCGEGYKGDICSECDKEYYMVNGECKGGLS